MDWNSVRNKRTSVSGILSFPNYQNQTSPQRFPVSAYLTEDASIGSGVGGAGGSGGSFYTHGPNESRTSYFESQHPIYCADWKYNSGSELVALSSFREGYQNRIQIVQGSAYHRRNEDDTSNTTHGIHGISGGGNGSGSGIGINVDDSESFSTAFNFSLAAEVPVDYPVTHLQWDPLGYPRIAASLEVLRLYQFDFESSTEPTLVQTHLLANNSTVHGSGTDSYDINTFPPVTSFDWNSTDPSIVITLSVDTTCTVWDLNRSVSMGKLKNLAQVKTQLIAHDSEVFDVKFIHKSTNVFASVSNDGSMRVFDLRSLEHSTIIYEPTVTATGTGSATGALPESSGAIVETPYNPQALLRLLTSNVDQHHLATVGVNLNQVLIIDMRMPGVPVATLDGLFGGVSHTAINLISWNTSSNLLLTGGDDCQALVWDFTRGTGQSMLSIASHDGSVVVDTPELAYLEDLEVNNVCWREGGSENWMGVVSGKGFQAVQAW